MSADGHADGLRTGVRGAGRVSARRASLPNGRVLVGALLIAAAAVAVFATWLGTTGSPGHPAVVVTEPLAAGTTLSAGDLSTSKVQLAPSTAARTFADPSSVIGRTLSAPLAPGELLQTSDLVAVGGNPPLRPVAITADTSDAATLAVGDLVDVVVTQGSAATSSTSVVLRGARVIALTGASGGLASVQTTTVVTIGVSSLSEVTAVVHAERTGTVNVVVGEASDGSGLAVAGNGAGPGTGSTSGAP